MKNTQIAGLLMLVLGAVLAVATAHQGLNYMASSDVIWHVMTTDLARTYGQEIRSIEHSAANLIICGLLGSMLLVLAGSITLRHSVK